MKVSAKGRVGDRLLEKGWVTEEQLELALGEQRRAHRPLGQILLSLGFVKPEHIVLLVAEDLELEFLRARDIQPDPALVEALDPEFVRRTQSFPIGMSDGALQIIMVQPDDPQSVAAVRERFPFPLKLAITTEDEIQVLLRAHVRQAEDKVAEILTGLAERGVQGGDDFPIEKIADALLVDGVHRGATDVHIEPEERVTRVRYRIDGILCQGENLPLDATAAILSRIKIQCGLDIAERRRPQDGRLRMQIDGRPVDMRVSFMPCISGENCVIRILDRSVNAVGLRQLGIDESTVSCLRRITERPHGLFLVTGPTGSGKTTTLYAMLGDVDAVRRNVATVEDPVEYRMPLLRQSQVDPSIGFHFEQGLRSLLRQDPDVILVGEVRDKETASMAVKASMTGHLVFSTLHTNTAIGALPRLIDIGIEPFLVEDSLIGVLAQRLVRKICASCEERFKPSAEELDWLGRDVAFVCRGTGCERCGGTGYSGRTAITELFLPNDEMADVIRAGADVTVLKRLAARAGHRTMFDVGRDRVVDGLTTIDEVERVNKSHRLAEGERAGL